MAEDIDFKFTVKQSCGVELKKLCSNVPQGENEWSACEGEWSAWEGEWRAWEGLWSSVDPFMPCSSCLSPRPHSAPPLPPPSTPLPGRGAHVQCLQENLDSAEMGEDCRKEVKKDMERAAQGEFEYFTKSLIEHNWYYMRHQKIVMTIKGVQ